MKVVIATIKSWNIKNAEKLNENLNEDVAITIVSTPKGLVVEKMLKINPDFIFFPHWSWMIPSEIYEKFNCVVFHMTDLPYGRGGSPLQNLIIRGVTKTKISALKVIEKFDAGPIYSKRNLELQGTADDILKRASKIIFKSMIPEIINTNIIPMEQTGEVVIFNRRSPEESVLQEQLTLEQFYDQIRMLDGEGYPKAFIRLGDYKLTFSKASLKSDEIIAEVKIVEDKL